mmetsp:Transcript_35297/g.77314  ORF Transcript_35297/g.77314 Transcript_35297/m.77314 type:complete len:287 (+) Transcript_35297:4456-5316(+)
MSRPIRCMSTRKLATIFLLIDRSGPRRWRFTSSKSIESGMSIRRTVLLSGHEDSDDDSFVSMSEDDDKAAVVGVDDGGAAGASPAGGFFPFCAGIVDGSSVLAGAMPSKPVEMACIVAGAIVVASAAAAGSQYLIESRRTPFTLLPFSKVTPYDSSVSPIALKLEATVPRNQPSFSLQVGVASSLLVLQGTSEEGTSTGQFLANCSSSSGIGAMIFSIVDILYMISNVDLPEISRSVRKLRWTDRIRPVVTESEASRITGQPGGKRAFAAKLSGACKYTVADSSSD